MNLGRDVSNPTLKEPLNGIVLSVISTRQKSTKDESRNVTDRAYTLLNSVDSAFRYPDQNQNIKAGQQI